MKESFPEFTNPPRLMQSPESVKPRPTGFPEARQEEGVSLSAILNGLRKYWYASVFTTALMMGVIGYVTWKQVRIYRSAVQIAIDLKGGNSFAEKLAGGVDSNGQSEDRTIALETITQSLRSRSMIEQAINMIPDPKMRPSVGQVLAGLAIQTKPDSNVLTVSYTSLSQNEIVTVLNALSKVYIDYSIKTKKARTNNSIEFIESQLPASRKRLEASASQIEQFRIKYRFVDPATSAGALDGYRQGIVAKINESRSVYYQTQKQYEELKKQLASVGLSSEGNLSTTMLTQDSAYQELFKQLNDLELKYNQESVRFSSENPLVVSLKEKRDGVLVLLRERAQQVLKRQVEDSELTKGGISNFGNNLAQNLANKQAELETSLVAQTAQAQSLEAVYQQVQTQIAQLPGLQKQYTEMQREYQIASQELTAFLQKVQELKIVNAEQVVPWRLLDPPEYPNFPVSPDVPRQLGMGAVGSLLAGILVSVGLNKLDDRVDNPDSVKAMTGMPVLSLIPRVDDLDRSSSMRGGTFLQTAKGKNKDYSYWSFVEAIRTLALGIGLTSDREEKQAGKIIAMTSSLPKEGKSTIVFHTSNTLAELGYRVLLIDADMHKSSIAQLCANSPLFKREDCDIEDGLSDAIVGSSNWKDLIKVSPESQLHVLFSGKQTVSSIVLFNSPRLIRLMEEWRKEYDYVLFDTPPIVGVSNTRLLSSLVDGLVYIVSLNVAQKQIIDRGIDIISSGKTPVLGLAINRVENHHSGYNKYYQYYHASHELHEKNDKSKLLNPEQQGVEVTSIVDRR
ncbi:GumC family protein [Chamaesiphon minutus]|uniref:non-specific protein-tyrosine kinase n=1 Tax=Chamaesiphon minutus (strain ATCC 27169 / PCC 6605) TaxID=1173020 RepID=K9U9T4_CHAP6|nr:AAA family ATPase [Chamaesiphon minutus]AFY91595.1 ATPase involved in chromosome partitioning [Chamaesiphon minutus PCC 6605]